MINKISAFAYSPRSKKETNKEILYFILLPADMSTKKTSNKRARSEDNNVIDVDNKYY